MGESGVKGVKRFDGSEWRDLTRDELRRELVSIKNSHDPQLQVDHSYTRCVVCNYTRHPCDAWLAATLALWILDEGRDGTRDVAGRVGGDGGGGELVVRDEVREKGLPRRDVHLAEGEAGEQEAEAERSRHEHGRLTSRQALRLVDDL